LPLPDTLRRAISDLPHPLAETLAALEGTTRRRELVAAERAFEAACARWIGAVALAATGSDRQSVALSGLAALAQRRLDPDEWFALARSLDTGGNAALAEVLGAMTWPAGIVDSGPEDVFAACERLVGVLAPLGRYDLAVSREGIFEAWMGPRRPIRATLAGTRRALPDGQPALVDREGGPPILLAPFALAQAPSPGAPFELFLYDGPGRQGGKWISTPLGFEHHDAAAWDRLAGALGASTSVSAEGAPPYLGLRPYTRADGDLFVGREAEIAAAANRLRADPLVVVVGPSGSGKSSFVQAGLLGQLGEDWLSVIVRPGPDPFATLAGRLERDLNVTTTAEELRDDPERLGARKPAGRRDGER
jgi:hypothetical protein